LAIFTFRACGVNPTLQLTGEQYTRNMAVWYIRNMGGLRSCFTAVFVRLLSIPFASAGGGGDSRCSAMATWMSQRASAWGGRDRQTHKKTDYVVHDLRREIAEIAGWNGAPGEETAVGWNTKARKRMLITPRRKWSVWCNAASGVIEVPEVDREGWAE